MNEASDLNMREADNASAARRWVNLFPKLPFAEGTAVTSANTARLLIGGNEIVSGMTKAVDAAEKTVTFQFYNMECDEGGLPFKEAFLRARRRGIRVAGVLDRLVMIFMTNGRWWFRPHDVKTLLSMRQERRRTREMLWELNEAGVEIVNFLPPPWRILRRNHRKSMVVDGVRAFVGGFNPTAHNLSWHDVCLELSGPVAGELDRLFNTVAKESGLGPVDIPPDVQAASLPIKGVTAGLITTDPSRRDCGVLDFIEAAADLAEESITVENAYISDYRFLSPLIRAARKGVKVTIIVPQRSNHANVDHLFRLRVEELERAGVRIYRYPGMTHAKIFSIDRALVSVGSTNFDFFGRHTLRELNVVAVDPSGRLGAEAEARVFTPDKEAGRAA